MPLFRLTRNGKVIVQRTLDELSPQEPIVDVAELQPYGFEVENAESDTSYTVTLGDETADDPGDGNNTGKRRRRTVVWEDRAWFESARGFVSVRILSRLVQDDGPWVERMRVLVYARPTKISEGQYRGMANSLTGLSAGLLFDVVGKAGGRVGAGRQAERVPIRPPHLELQAIERVWHDIQNSLDEIGRQPVLKVARRAELGQCWGAERLLPSALSQLAARGADPRKRIVPRPFAALRQRLEETVDTPEHRSIAGFLDVLARRLGDCEVAIKSHVQSIEAERPYRTRGDDAEGSLYDTIDVPRLRKLSAAKGRTRAMRRQILRVRRGELFGELRAEASLPPTPVFLHVVPYRQIRSSARRYLRSSLAMIDLAPDVRAKSTGRMYEQWIFLQLANAFVQAGLKGRAIDQIVRQIEGTKRFVVDLPRDARVVLQAADGRGVRLRYEPHVFGRDIAAARRDTVYRGIGGDSPWSPDVLIEVLPSADAEEQAVITAIVVDAKYSRRVHEEQWRDTSKYHQIRSTLSKRPVVRQVWLAHPSATQTVRPRDASVSWTESGPDVPWDEPLDGTISVVPPECKSENDEDAIGAGAQVAPVMLEFALGITRSLTLT